MAIIGNQVISQAFVTDQFSGNGSTTAFTMSVAPANTASVLVAVSGVLQDPSTYSVSGTTLTFSAAPPTATGNISARYLGIPASGVTTTAYRTITEFTATAAQTTFTPASYTVGFIEVYRNGVLLGSADYTASNGTTVVLAIGATAGDLVTTISFYVSSVLNAIPATGGSVGITYLDVGSGTGTGAMVPPTGTTAQRPSSPAAGAQRWNTTLGVLEVWTGSAWSNISPNLYSATYLVVGGGAGAGGFDARSGGGGGGGVLSGSTTFSLGVSYSVTVGAGGTGGNGSTRVQSTNGTSSVLSTLATATGGGGGGLTASFSDAFGNGLAGASGGGGGGANGIAGTGGAGTSGQGFAGGAGVNSATASGGGGGGSAAVGVAGAAGAGGTGGAGVLSSISGTATNYGGGGGGGGQTTNGSGGAGGGGAAGATGTAGTANRGGGGGASGAGVLGSSGGSGVVIISYLGAQKGTGGTVTSSGGYTIHTFTSSGTFTA